MDEVNAQKARGNVSGNLKYFCIKNVGTNKWLKSQNNGALRVTSASNCINSRNLQWLIYK